MGAAPAEHAGIASAVNNVVARAAGLLAVAVLPLLSGLTGASALGATALATGFRTAMLISGFAAAAGGVVAAFTIRNPAQTSPPVDEYSRTWHCAVGNPPLRPDRPAATTGGAAR
jgi:hypothetical protein